MWRALLIGLGGAVLVYLALGAALFAFQRSMLYVPQAARGKAPAAVLSVPGAQLQISQEVRSGRRAVLYFGGNAEDVSSSLAGLADTFSGQSVYALHYRGYGRSTGSATEAALQADALALFDHVAPQHAEITVVGRSLGSALAVALAARRPVTRLVLVTPFDSIEAVASHHYPLFPVRWLIQDRFDAAALAPRVRAPTTVIVADRDEVIPRARTDALLARFAPGVAQAVLIVGAGHNTLDGRPAYDAALQRGFVSGPEQAAESGGAGVQAGHTHHVPEAGG